jgi:hypothetical protein
MAIWCIAWVPYLSTFLLSPSNLKAHPGICIRICPKLLQVDRQVLPTQLLEVRAGVVGGSALPGFSSISSLEKLSA